jgi:hypothetical protein
MPVSEKIKRLGEREAFGFVLVERLGGGELAAFLAGIPK